MDLQVKKSISALRLNFFFLGILVAGWSTRIPELKTALNLTDAQLGRCLIGSALGAFLSSRIIGKLIKDLGTKKTFILGSCLFPLGYLTIAFGPSGFFVFLGCFFFSIGYLFMDNPMTIITQEIEAIEDRKYLSGFHGFWSIGTLFAGFFGSFLIGHVKYSYHLTGLAIISFAEYGNPNGKPVLFVHGGPGGGTVPAMARFFDPNAYRIILVDFYLVFIQVSITLMFYT